MGSAKYGLWLNVVLLLVALSFSGTVKASDPVSCTLTEDVRPLSSYNPNLLQNLEYTYIRCIAAEKVVWTRASLFALSKPTPYYGAGSYVYGRFYETREEAITGVASEVIQELGSALDWSNNGCYGCSVLTTQVFQNIFNSSSSGCKSVQWFSYSPFDDKTPCSPITNWVVRSDPSAYVTSGGVNYDDNILQLTRVALYNPTPQTITVSPGSNNPTNLYYVYGGNGSYNSSSVNNFVVNRPICPEGWQGAQGWDENNLPVLACYLSVAAARAFGMSGLDSTLDGCGVSCNPVNLSTGAKMDYAEDYRNFSSFPIVWDRYYHSQSGKWTFGYDRSIYVWTDSLNQIKKASLKRPDGTVILFKDSGSMNTPWIMDTETNQTLLGTLKVRMISGIGAGFVYQNLKDEREYYNLQGQLIEIQSRQGQSLHFEYNNQGQLIKIEDDFGRHLDIVRTAPNQFGVSWIEAISDGTTSVLYDQSMAQGAGASHLRVLLNAVSKMDGGVLQYLYDENGTPGRGLLTSIIDETGLKVAAYTYDDQNRVASSLHNPNGWDTKNAISYNYLNNYGISPTGSTEVTWATGSAQVSTAPLSEGIPKIAGSSQHCPVCFGAKDKALVYDTRGNPISRTDFKNVTTDLTYETDRGLPTSLKEAVGSSQERTTSFQWHPDFRLPKVIVEPIDVNGVAHTKTTTLTYNSEGLVTQKVISTSTNEPSRTWTYTYNNKGLMLTETTPEMRQTVYTYHANNGNLLTITNPEGHVTTFGNYTPSGQPQLITSPNGLQTKITYDVAQRVIKVEKGTPSTHWETTIFAYNTIGKIKQIDYPNGDWKKMTYNAIHQLQSIQTPTGSRNVFTDNQSRPLSITSSDNSFGNFTYKQFQYDEVGNVIKQTGGQTNIDYTYDEENRLSSITDQVKLSTSSQSYDALGRLHQSTDENNQVYQYAYNSSDALTSALDSRSNATTYVYNGFGDQVGLTSPDAGPQSWSVNKEGEVISKTDARGVVSTITRDDLGRITQIVFDGASVNPSSAGWVAGNETQTWVYDVCPNGVGNVCSMTDASGTTTYAYDVWGRRTQKAFQPAGASFSLTVQYTYDQTGQLVETRYPSQRSLVTSYQQGDATALNYDGVVILENASYLQLHGPSKGWTWGNGLGALQYNFDNEHRISSMSGETNKTFVYAGNHRLLAQEGSGNSSHDGSFYYDGKNQLTFAALVSRPTDLYYSYDANGNRLKRENDPFAPTESLTANYATSSNRLMQIQNLGGSTSNWVYDASGNLIQEQNQSYTYDAKGRMNQAISSGNHVKFTYNAQGQRMSKERLVGNIGKDYFVHDEDGRLLGIYDQNGQLKEEFVWFDGWRPVASIRGSGAIYDVYRITSDPLGAPISVRDNNGVKVWEWDGREPFGFEHPNEDPDGNSTYFKLNLRFPGQWADEETGLYHNGFRDYHPNAGRYIQSDPLGLEAGWNTYAYVGSNPVNETDLFGLSKKDEDLIGIVFSSTVNYMTKNGMRYNDPEINNMFANQKYNLMPEVAKKWMGSRDGGFLDCNGQSYFLLLVLNDFKQKNKFDDEWIFSLDHRPGHTFLVGYTLQKSSSDPIWMDPRANEISIGSPCAACLGRMNQPGTLTNERIKEIQNVGH